MMIPQMVKKLSRYNCILLPCLSCPLLLLYCFHCCCPPRSHDAAADPAAASTAQVADAATAAAAAELGEGDWAQFSNFPLDSCWRQASNWRQTVFLIWKFWCEGTMQIALFQIRFCKLFLGRDSPSPLPRPLSPFLSRAVPSIPASSSNRGRFGLFPQF